MGVEYEWKFRAEPQIQEELYRATEGPWQQTAMETTYYDTQDNQLSALHYTLRRRMENGRSVCTVKTPLGDGGRGDWEVEEAFISQAIPKLCKLGAPEILLSIPSVTPICGARFTRRACKLDIGTAVVELALDQGVLLGGGRENPLCEIEIEWKGGQKAAAAAFATHLAKKYGLSPETKSKFRRALDLTKE